MDELHFLRPWWLIALPLGLAAIWYLLGGRGSRGSWLAVVDAPLQPYVLASPEALGASRWPLLTALMAWLLATLALAGPTWERLPVPAFRSDDALVIALDLSRSMDAGDIEPSRLARARLKLLNLLERRGGGQTALVVFSAHAFTVTPLTTDVRTIASLVSSLTTDIMPSQGSYPEAGLTRARQLLEQSGMTRGEILLVTDANPSPQSRDVVAELHNANFPVSVLGVGTPDGAPIPEPGGGFLSDDRGQVVVPQLDVAALRRLADVGGGRFSQLTADDRDLDVLFSASGGLSADVLATDEAQDHEADVWRDAGVWFTAALLPFIALGFRRGWLVALAACVLAPVPRADAFEWRDLWQRRDQQGFEALQADHPEQAAALFDSPEWRAAAEYRSGDYSTSAATLAPLAGAEAHYNRGNALARAGQLEAAISAYDLALEIDPDHEDARYNRDLVQDLLDQQQQQQEQQNQQQQQASDEQKQQSGQDGEGDPGGQSQQSADNQGGENEPQDGNDQNDGEDEEQQAQDEEGQDENETEAGQQQVAAAPRDVEQWASEQAAEQWLRRIPQDPGGLLRRKFLYQYQRFGVDQEGNYVWPGDEKQPW